MVIGCFQKDGKIVTNGSELEKNWGEIGKQLIAGTWNEFTGNKISNWKENKEVGNTNNEWRNFCKKLKMKYKDKELGTNLLKGLTRKDFMKVEMKLNEHGMEWKF